MDSFHARQGRSRPVAFEDTDETGVRAQPRADQLLVELGLAASRTAARRLIEAGRVSWQDLAGVRVVRKPAEAIPATAQIAVEPDDSDRFVSRGGLKLAGALQACALDVRGRHCLDVGQSTGGFSDCLLQAGAASVLGVEVGHDQLHARLRAEPRCATIEGLNARDLDARQLGAALPPGGFDLIVCDASFISLGLLLPRWPALLKGGGEILSLVKPQFEVGPQGVGRGGIVRDESLYGEVEGRIRALCASLGLRVQHWCDSPIKGGDGNREFFIHAVKPGDDPADHGAV